MNNTTYIIGYWKINGNYKHDLEHYIRYLPKTLNILINCNIVFFYQDDDILEFVKKYVKTDKIIYIKRTIEELETFTCSDHFVNLCLLQNYDDSEYYNKTIDKGYKHLTRDCIKSGEIVFKKLFTIWTSKIYLIKEIIDANYFNTEYFAWMDASISRINKHKHFYTLLKYSPKYLFHFGSNCYYKKEKLNIACGYMNAHKDVWNEILPIYNKIIEDSKTEEYGFDEEILFHKVAKQYNFFCCLENIYIKPNSIFKNVSLKYGMIYVHIPKTGGSTIETIFFNDIINRKKKICSEHFPIQKYNKFNNFFSFTIVRNPYTRILSIYNYYMKGGNQSILDKNILDKTTTLDNFLVKYNNENLPHLNTQAYYINNNVDNIDYIGRFENFENEVFKIAERIKLLITTVENVRKTDYETYIITPKFINNINQLYNIDFELFNYNKITITENITLEKLFEIIS